MPQEPSAGGATARASIPRRNNEGRLFYDLFERPLRVHVTWRRRHDMYVERIRSICKVADDTARSESSLSPRTAGSPSRGRHVVMSNILFRVRDSTDIVGRQTTVQYNLYVHYSSRARLFVRVKNAE